MDVPRADVGPQRAAGGPPQLDPGGVGHVAGVGVVEALIAVGRLLGRQLVARRYSWHVSRSHAGGAGARFSFALQHLFDALAILNRDWSRVCLNHIVRMKANRLRVCACRADDSELLRVG